MATEDQANRNIGRRRLGKAARAVPLPVLVAKRGRALAALDKEGQAAARQRARLGSLIATVSASFVGLPARCIDGSVEQGLHLMIEALGVDYGAFCQNTDDGLAVAHSWPVDIFESSSNTQRANELTRLAESLRRNVVFVVSQPETLSKATDEGEFLSRLGLKAAAFIGVMTGESLSGALVLGSSGQEIALTDDQVQQLQILGAVFAGALKHKQAEETLIETDKLNRAMLDSLASHIVVVDEGGRVIAISAGRHGNAESGMTLLTGVSLGANYFDTCRQALERGLESAGRLLDGIEAVVDGAREMFEMEYEYLSPSHRKFFQVSVTPLSEASGGAVISHIETTERKMAQVNLRELSGKMIRSLEEERTRIARDLHDDVSQRLALMGIEMEQMMQGLPKKQNDVRRRLRDLWGHNQETSLEVRRLSHNLHCSKLEYLGLVAAVKSLCNELSNHQELRILFKHFDVPSSIPKDAALCIYRVVQESLRNVIKHSGARKAKVELAGGDGEINLCISDEGSGFDPDNIKTKAGIGLISIRERLLLIGGEVSIESQPSRGTRIVARVPLPAQGQDANVVERR